MRAWYRWLRTGPIARGYHRSGVWAWNLTPKLGFFVIYPVIGYLFFWQILLTLPLLFLGALVAALLPFNPDAEFWALGCLAAIAIAPPLLRNYGDCFVGYFAIVALLFKKSEAASQMLTYHQTKLTELTP